MAVMLKDILNGVISTENLFLWLSGRSDTVDEVNYPEISRADFVLHFQNFLRDQASRILTHSSSIGHSPSKHLRQSKETDVKYNTLNQQARDCQSSQQSARNARKLQLFPPTPDVESSDSINSKPDPTDNGTKNSCRTEIGSNIASNRTRRASSVDAENLGNEQDANSNSFVKRTSYSLSPSSVIQVSEGTSGAFRTKNTKQQTFCNGVENKESKKRSPFYVDFRSPHSIKLADFIVQDKRNNKKKALRQATDSGNVLMQEQLCTPNIEDKSTFPDISAANNQAKKQKRRINPTRLVRNGNSENQNSKGKEPNFGAVSRAFVPCPKFQEVAEISSKNLEEERRLLRQEKEKQRGLWAEINSSRSISCMNSPPGTPQKMSSRTSLCSVEYVLPSLSEVTLKQKLDILSAIYNHLMECNIVLNTMSELYFLIQLLVVQESISPELLLEECSEKDNLYLDTVHNCVYFSTSVLNKQSHILQLLDIASIRILSENNRISTFVPELQQFLLTVLESNSGMKRSLMFKSSVSGVSFQADTDNKPNFPCEQGFHVFRKQRDMFYEIIRLWEANHMSPGFTFGQTLSSKVQCLLNLHTSAVNYVHFARLFQSQLINMCKGDSVQIQNSSELENLCVLKSLKHVDPKKLQKLQERLVTPLKIGSGSSFPTFPGYQEFFRDFILHASNPKFNDHLKDSLISKLIELNETEFSPSEVEEADNKVDEDTRQEFLTCILTLRLLAKFLGFIIFLPYQSSAKESDNIIALQCAVRSKVSPSLDICKYIRESVEKRKLILTLPWIVEYLSMIDSVSVHLPYYESVFILLIYIYQNILVFRKHDENVTCLKVYLPPFSVFFLRISLGWLFELANFPDELFYMLYSKLSPTSVKRTDGSEAMLTRRDSPFSPEVQAFDGNICDTLCHKSPSKPDRQDSTEEEPRIENCASVTDALDVIDNEVLYLCYPFLTQLKVLLLESGSNSFSSIPVRHITPISACDQQPSSVRHLQVQLEDNFFHNQPASVKKTVEFVAERVASKCVKYFCNTVLPGVRESALERVRQIVREELHDAPVSGEASDNIKGLLSKKSQATAEKICCELKRDSTDMVSRYCEEKCTEALSALLSDEMLGEVVKMCACIASRLSKGRVNSWISIHVSVGAFMKEYRSEIDKMMRAALQHENSSEPKMPNILPPGGRNVEHQEDATTPPQALIQLQDFMWEILNREVRVDSAKVERILDMITSTIQNRADLMPYAEKTLQALTVDFALALVTHCPDAMNNNVQQKFVGFWKICDGPLNLSRILCPRNILMFAQSKQPFLTWNRLEFLLVEVVNCKLLSLPCLEQQCLTLLHQQWPQDILNKCASCIQVVLDAYKRTNSDCDSELILLMDWLVEVYATMEIMDS